jgi:hypothetical protein
LRELGGDLGHDARRIATVGLAEEALAMPGAPGQRLTAKMTTILSARMLWRRGGRARFSGNRPPAKVKISLRAG